MNNYSIPNIEFIDVKIPYFDVPVKILESYFDICSVKFERLDDIKKGMCYRVYTAQPQRIYELGIFLGVRRATIDYITMLSENQNRIITEEKVNELKKIYQIK